MNFKKIGLFFGSFNPIHVGHMAIANYMAEFTDMEEVWLVVSPQNPFKKNQTMLGAHHRMNLIRAGIGDYKKIKPCDAELKLPEPNYTINTLRQLSEQYPAKEFVLIMGKDNLFTFDKWKDYEEILKDYEIYVYPRKGIGKTPFDKHPKVTIIHAPVIEVSATFIRNALKEKKDVRFLLPESAAKYRTEMHFYEK